MEAGKTLAEFAQERLGFVPMTIAESEELRRALIEADGHDLIGIPAGQYHRTPIDKALLLRPAVRLACAASILSEPPDYDAKLPGRRFDAVRVVPRHSAEPPPRDEIGGSPGDDDQVSPAAAAKRHSPAVSAAKKAARQLFPPDGLGPVEQTIAAWQDAVHDRAKRNGYRGVLGQSSLKRARAALQDERAVNLSEPS